MESKIQFLAKKACYAYWSTLMSPLKDTNTFWNLRTSEEQLSWLASVRTTLEYLNDLPNITSASENALTKEDVIRMCLYGGEE